MGRSRRLLWLGIEAAATTPLPGGAHAVIRVEEDGGGDVEGHAV